MNVFLRILVRMWTEEERNSSTKGVYLIFRITNIEQVVLALCSNVRWKVRLPSEQPFPIAIVFVDTFTAKIQSYIHDPSSSLSSFRVANNLHSFRLYVEVIMHAIALDTSKTNRLFEPHCVQHVILRRKTRKWMDLFESVKLRVATKIVSFNNRATLFPFTFRTFQRQYDIFCELCCVWNCGIIECWFAAVFGIQIL